MKKLLLLLLLPIAATAQQTIPADIDNFPFVYTGIQAVPGVSARIIQSRARLMEKSDWQLARIASLAYIQAFIDRVNAALQADDLDPDKSDF